MNREEELRTKITKDDYRYRRVVKVEIEATGDQKETFEEIRDAVNEILES